MSESGSASGVYPVHTAAPRELPVGDMPGSADFGPVNGPVNGSNPVPNGSAGSRLGDCGSVVAIVVGVVAVVLL